MEEEPLEDLELPSTLLPSGLGVGDVLEWGGQRYVVTGPSWSSWWPAVREGSEDAVYVRPGADGEYWQGLPKQQILPRIGYAGPEGCVIERIDAEPLQLPLKPSDAGAIALRVSQLVRFLLASRNRLAVIDLEPETVVDRAGDVCLLLLPRVAPVGQLPARVLREGMTPPEVVAGEEVSGREGVYVTAALLFRLLTGTAVPVGEGPALTACAVAVPGIRQFLAQALESAALRPDAGEAVAMLRRLFASPVPEYRVALATTIGLNTSRHLNEDSAGYTVRVVEGHEATGQVVRACVADGMGGMAAGETASRVAVDAFLGFGPAQVSPEALAGSAVDAAWEANRAVVEVLAGRDGGCTFTGVVIAGSTAALAHVGDTRAYVLSGGSLRQLTRDHSLVASQVASGLLTPEQAETSPERATVLRSMGSLRARRPGYIEGTEFVTGSPTISLAPGDRLLLVSDGVWGELPDREIEEILLRESTDSRAAADGLIEAVLKAGASDNATVVIVSRER